MVIGSAVALTFGAVFVLVNSGDLADPWPLVIRAAGLAVAAMLVVALVLVARKTTPARASAYGYPDRRFWIIVAAEAVAFVAGLVVINGVLQRPEVGVAWVALVVGVHFFGLGWIWRIRVYHRLGAVMTALGLAGFLIDALGGSAGTVGLVAGVGSGAALYLNVGAVLRNVWRGRPPATA